MLHKEEVNSSDIIMELYCKSIETAMGYNSKLIKQKNGDFIISPSIML